MIHFPASITTERLTIRPWRHSDADPLWDAVNESIERLSVYMPWTVHYTSRSAATQFIADAIKRAPAGYELPLAMVERATGRILGGTGFHSTEPTADGWRTLEIGYWLRGSAQGNGYMREAVRAQLRLALELGVERIQLLCDARNRPSWRVAESCGFRREAVLRRDARDHHGALRDTRMYGLIPSELRELCEGWSDEPYELDWADPPFERPAVPAHQDVTEGDKPELPVVLTELVRLDPVNLLEPGLQFTVVDRGANRHLGLATLLPRKADVPSFGLKWSFGTPDEPIEFGIEVGLALLKIAFEELDAERVEMRVPVDATLTREVAEILGFVNEGVLRAHKTPIDGVIGDFVIYSVIKDDL